MTAQGNVSARPLSEAPSDVLSVPADDTAGNPAQDAGTEIGKSRCGAGTRSGNVSSPLLWERFLHNLMATLGAWTI
jgi:hypothetical protein